MNSKFEMTFAPKRGAGSGRSSKPQKTRKVTGLHLWGRDRCFVDLAVRFDWPMQESLKVCSLGEDY